MTSAALPQSTVEFDSADTARLDDAMADRAPAPEPAAPSAPASASDENSRTFAITSFVLGIASIVSGWTVVAPAVGLIFGIISLRRNTSERTLALWGVWLNAAMLALTALFIIAMAVVFATVGIAAFSAPWVLS